MSEAKLPFNVLVEYESRAQWLQARTKGLGGSEISILMGHNEYNSPQDLYYNKVSDRALIDGMKDNEAMEAGRMLEPAIIDWWAEKHNETVIKNSSIFIHKDHYYMLATVDAIIKRGSSDYGVLECKNVGADNRSWDDGLPRMYQDQTLHYMNVLGLKWGIVVALIGGRSLRVYPVEWDPDYISIMNREAEHFWKRHVIPRIPPPPLFSDDCIRMFPKEIEGKKVEATIEVVDLYDEKRKVAAIARQAKADLNLIDAKLKAIIGDAETLEYKGKRLASWRSTQASGNFDRKILEREFPDVYRSCFKQKGGNRVLKIYDKSGKEILETDVKPIIEKEEEKVEEIVKIPKTRKPRKLSTKQV